MTSWVAGLTGPSQVTRPRGNDETCGLMGVFSLHRSLWF